MKLEKICIKGVKIKYRFSKDGAIITKCPFKRKTDFGEIIRVAGSDGFCKHCERFIAANYRKQFVICKGEEAKK